MSTVNRVRSSRLTKLAAIVAASMFALAACGGNGETAETDAPTDTETTAPAGGEADGDADADADAGAEASTDPIRLTGVPAEEADALVSKFELLMDVIEGETGRPVEFQTSTDYAAVIEALLAGQADMAIGSPFTYVRAGDQGAEVEVLGGRVEEEGDELGYVSYALVTPGSDITGLADLAGRAVCYVDQGSTSGFLYPSAGMLDAGLDPIDDVEAIFAGSHDGAVLALLDGQCDLAFAYDSMVEVLMPGRDLLEPSDYEVIWESPVIPASPIFMNTATLDQATQDALRGMFQDGLVNVNALVEAGYCDSVNECSLPEDSFEYAPVDDSIYDGIREVCEITQAEACA